MTCQKIIIKSTKSALLLLPLLLCINLQLHAVASFTLPSIPFSPAIRGTISKNLSGNLFVSTDALSSSEGKSENRKRDNKRMENLTPGTVVTERYLYRFSPTDSDIQSPYAIEERQYYAVAADKSLEPLGDKSIIFRGGERNESGNRNPSEDGKPGVYTQIGPALYALEGLKEQEDPDGLEDSSTYAIALYCMEHPKIVRGRGLEVGCREGIGGILSVVATGLASDPQGYLNMEEHSEAPAPKDLSKILMTDRNPDLLKKSIDNLEAASFPETKVKLGLLDWNKDTQDDMKDQCQFIIGCHSARNFAPLARTVAYALKCSPFEGQSDGLRTRASFLHIEPCHRENVNRLQSELKNGYRMNTKVTNIVLERVHLVPLIMDSKEDSEEQLRDDIAGEIGGFVEYQHVVSSKYSALVGYHSKHYYGLNGRYFFPSEQARAERRESAIMGNNNQRNTIVGKNKVRSPQEIAAEEERVSREKAAEEERLAKEKAEEEARVIAEKAEKERLQKLAVAAEKKQRSILSKRLQIEAAEKEKIRLQMEKAEREKMDRVRKVYLEWCGVFKQNVDEARFRIFASNFLAMEAFADENGTEIKLNQWYDCTEEEFNAKRRFVNIDDTTASAAERSTSATNQDTIKSEEAKLRAEKEAKRKADEYRAKVQADEEARLKQVAEQEEKRKAEYQARLKAEEEERQQKVAEQEAKSRAEYEARLQADEAFRQKQIAEEDARKKAEYLARKKAEEEARQRQIAEIEAKRQAEYKAQVRAAEEARQLRVAEEEAKHQAQNQARLQAEEDARKKSEYHARKKSEEEARSREVAEEEARLKAEYEAQSQAERKANQDEVRSQTMEEARLLKVAEDEVKAKAEKEALIIANVEGMMSLQRERFVADAKMKALVEFRSGKTISSTYQTERRHKNNVSHENHDHVRDDAGVKATVENEYRLAVEAETQAKSEARAKADEWYRLAELEAKAKIVTQEAQERLAAEEARIKAEEEYRIAAENEKWAMAQAQAKADEWYRLAQVESAMKARDGMNSKIDSNHRSVKAVEASGRSSIFPNAEGMVSAESEKILNDEIMNAALNSGNTNNRVNGLQAIESQTEAHQLDQEAGLLRAAEAEVRAKAENEAKRLADSAGLMSVERERLIAEAKVNAVVDFRKNLAKEAEEVTKLKEIAATIEQGSTYASSHEMESAEEKNNSRVRSIYLDWCRDYGKEVNEMRYPIFRSNFILMEAFAKESGKPIELNEWYDCTEEEYNFYNDGKVR